MGVWVGRLVGGGGVGSGAYFSLFKTSCVKAILRASIAKIGTKTDTFGKVDVCVVTILGDKKVVFLTS